MVTLADVAKAAGVSKSAVSKVLLGGGGKTTVVGKVTAQRVREVARQMNYSPNQLARGLRRKRSKLIGLVFESLASPPVTMMKLAQIERQARAAGFGLLIVNHDGDPKQEQSAIEQLVGNQVEGVLLWSTQGTQMVNDSLIADWAAKVPLMQIEPPISTTLNSVGIDREQGVMLQVRHMLGDLKCRRLLFAIQEATPEDRGPAAAKWRGYRRALAEFGQSLDDHWLIRLPAHIRREESFAVGQAVAGKLLASDNPVDGVIASSDVTALPILSALMATGRRVPEDVAIIGFDDEPFAAHLPIPLSTIHQPLEIGAVAYEMLMEQIQTPAEERQPIQRLLAPSLVVRASTAGRLQPPLD